MKTSMRNRLKARSTKTANRPSRERVERHLKLRVNSTCVKDLTTSTFGNVDFKQYTGDKTRGFGTSGRKKVFVTHEVANDQCWAISTIIMMAPVLRR